MKVFDITPITEISASRKIIRIPAFSYPVTWVGASELLAYYPIGNSIPISLALPFAGTDTFILAVFNGVNRYGLWLGPAFYFPLYNGETLTENSRVEVWSYRNTPAVSNSDIDLSTSELDLPTLQQTFWTNQQIVTLTPVYPVTFP